MIIYKIIVSFAFLFHTCSSFFFTADTSDYNNLATTQEINSSSPTTLPIKSSTLSTSIDNSTLSKNETQQSQEESPETTPVDQSAAFYTKAYVIAPRISGPLSILGSILIVTEVLQKKRRYRNAYHRILLAMSIIDINTSFWYSLSSLPIPTDTNHNSQAFCNAQGWGLQASIASPIYNTTLAMFYLLVIRYKWRKDKLRKAEYLFHVFPVVFGLGTSLAGLGLKIYGNANLWCWIRGDENAYR